MSQTVNNTATTSSATNDGGLPENRTNSAPAYAAESTKDQSASNAATTGYTPQGASTAASDQQGSTTGTENDASRRVASADIPEHRTGNASAGAAVSSKDQPASNAGTPAYTSQETGTTTRDHPGNTAMEGDEKRGMREDHTDNVPAYSADAGVSGKDEKASNIGGPGYTPHGTSTTADDHPESTDAAQGGKKQGRAAGQSVRGVVSGIHGLGETVRGNILAAVDEAFGNKEGAARGQRIAQEGEREMKAAKAAVGKDSSS